MIEAKLPVRTLKTLPLRLRHYLRERLPLWKYIPVVAATSYTAITFPAMLAHRPRAGLHVYLITFLISLLFMFQRRIIDDLRNASHDRTHRPYMPIPRGLVSANELRLVFALCIPLQAGLSMILDIRLLGPLLVVLLFLQGLTFDFGLRPLMRKHPIFALFSRMLAAPFVIYFATACEWLPRGDGPPIGVILLLLVSFSNSFVLEIGRKIQSPADTRPDVLSYTTLWGPRRAVTIWWLLLNVAAIFSSLARALRGASPDGMLILLAGILVAGAGAYHFASTLRARTAHHLDLLSILWTVTMFLTVVLR